MNLHIIPYAVPLQTSANNLSKKDFPVFIHIVLFSFIIFSMARKLFVYCVTFFLFVPLCSFSHSLLSLFIFSHTYIDTRIYILYIYMLHDTLPLCSSSHSLSFSLYVTPPHIRTFVYTRTHVHSNFTSFFFLPF